MPLLNSLRRTLSATLLLIALASAQQCYYPDGKTLATLDTPCNPSASDSACCPSNSFCLAGGACIAGGVVTRSSCTDKTWGSAACAGFCKTVGENAEIAITPCSTDTDSNTFACGLSADCSADTFTLPADTSLSLRPAQIASLVGSLPGVSSTPSAEASADTSGMVSIGALIGAAVGVGLPLLIALMIALIMLRREKKRFSKPKLMYKLPDECREEEDFTFRPPPSVPSVHPALRSTSSRTDAESEYSSRRGSFRTAAASPGLAPSPRPMQGTFMERYESMKKNAHGQTHEVEPRHELESTPPYREIERHEMGDYRRSQGSMRKEG